MNPRLVDLGGSISGRIRGRRNTRRLFDELERLVGRVASDALFLRDVDEDASALAAALSDPWREVVS